MILTVIQFPHILYRLETAHVHMHMGVGAHLISSSAARYL